VSAAEGGPLSLLIEREEPETRRHLPVVKVPHSRRGHTESMRRYSKRESARRAAAYPEQPGVDYQRPVTRADCLPGGANAQRPCPFVSCGHHLAVDVNERNGNIKINFPGADRDPDLDAMPHTCALDVADAGGDAYDSDGVTLDVLGDVLGITRQRCQQLEDAVFAKLRTAEPEAFAKMLDLIGVEVPSAPEARISERAMRAAEPVLSLHEMTLTSSGGDR